MQVKGWKLPPRATSEMNVKFRTAGEEQEEDDKRVNPISLSKDRLLSVEVIERRYLKVPLGQSKATWCKTSCPALARPTSRPKLC